MANEPNKPPTVVPDPDPGSIGPLARKSLTAMIVMDPGGPTLRSGSGTTSDFVSRFVANLNYSGHEWDQFRDDG